MPVIVIGSPARAWQAKSPASPAVHLAPPTRSRRAAAPHTHGINATDQHFDTIVDVIAPQGRFGLIDDPASFDVLKFKPKSASVHWESMFTRSVFQTADMDAQHHLLEEVAAMVDKGEIRTTLADTLGVINAANLKRAHALIEGGRTRGKLVLAGF